MLKEYINQLISGEQYEEIYDFINANDAIYEVGNAIIELLPDMGRDNLIRLFEGILSAHYTWEEAQSLVENVVGDLMNTLHDTAVAEDKKFLVRLASIHSDCFPEEAKQCGDPGLITDYFDSFQTLFDVYYHFGLIRDKRVKFAEMKEVYLYNKARYGAAMLHYRFLSSLFKQWHDVVYDIYKKCWYEEENKPSFMEALTELYDEIEWFMDNVGQKNIVPMISQLRHFSERFHNEIHSVLTNEESDHLSQRLQSLALSLYQENASHYAKKKFDEYAREIVDRYINQHKSKYSAKVLPYTTTPLMEFLGVPGYEESREELEKEAKEKDEARRSYEKKLMDEGGEATIGTVNLEEKEAWERSLNDIEIDEKPLCESLSHEDDKKENGSYEREEKIDTSDEHLEELLKEIDAFLSKNDIIDKYKNGYYDRLKCFLYLLNEISITLIKRNERKKAIGILTQNEAFFVRSIAIMGDNYALSIEAVKPVFDLAALYERCEEKNRAVKLLDHAVESIWHSYYHHGDGDGQRYLLNLYDKLYESYHTDEEMIRYYEKRFEIASLWQRNHSVNSFHLKYNDLYRLRPTYIELFDAYKKSLLIEKAVALLGKWTDICDATYIDCKDEGYGYSDYDRVYDQLAQLYDGTPRLYEAICAHAPRFLKDSAILVSKDGKWGYLDPETGREIIPLRYECGWRSFGEILSVKGSDGWGYITKDGMPCGKMNHNAAHPLQHGYGWTMDKDEENIRHYTLLTPNGEKPVHVATENLHEYAEGYFKVTLDTLCERIDMLSLDGKTLMFDGRPSKVYSPSHGLILAQFGGDWEIKNIQGEVIVPRGRYDGIMPFGTNRITPVSDDNGCGYINIAGEEVVPLKYSQCRPLVEGRGAIAKECGFVKYIWGFIDENGDTVVEPQYADVGDFSEGLAWVCISKSGEGLGFSGNKYGYISPDGTIAIPPIYDDASTFVNGKALVFIGDRAYYINHHGIIIGEF